MKPRTILALCIANLLYLLLGMVIFHYIESANEQDIRVTSASFLKEWMGKLNVRAGRTAVNAATDLVGTVRQRVTAQWNPTAYC